MNSRLKVAGIIMIFFLFLSSISLAVQYQTTGELPDGPQYKGIPETWWSCYFIKEFDKYAPSPGADWTEKQRVPASVANWYDSAQKSGWATSMNWDEPKVGAIAIRFNHSNQKANLYIVKEIIGETFIGTTFKYGDEYTSRFLLRELEDTKEGYVFLGYIYPEKLAK